MKPTLKELMDRAEQAIDRKEVVIYDVAAETGQIVGNVSHMHWFRRAVAAELAASTKKWAHLDGKVPQ